MAEDRRAQLELWREERKRARQAVETTTVAIQRRVVVPPQRAGAGRGSTATRGGRAVGAKERRVVSAKPVRAAVGVLEKRSSTGNTLKKAPVEGTDRQTAKESEDSGDLDTSMASESSVPASAEKPRKEKRRTSFILPSPSNLPALAGGAKRVLTPTRLSPPKLVDVASPAAMIDSEESDGGFGPSPRKKRAVEPSETEMAAPATSAESGTQDSNEKSGEPDIDAIEKLFEETETDGDTRSVRTTLSFGSISRPLRVLSRDAASDEDDDLVEKTPVVVTPSEHIEAAGTPPMRDKVVAPKVRASMDGDLKKTETENASRSGPPQRVAVRVLASSTASLGAPRRVSTGEGTASRKSLDGLKPQLTLEQRLEERRNWEMDDFAVTKNLGKGKFGNVYLAKEKHSNVSVALKVLYKSPLILDGGLLNLQREVEIQHRLNHPNLLRLHGYFYDEACIYLILEYASHGELYKLLSQEHHFSEAMAAHYIAQVVDALQYLHSCKVIHRDIKPENLLMGANHTIKLADFGWSVHASGKHSKRRTFCGTPHYLSPEILAHEEYDHRVDVWSVGVLAFEFLYGTTPFHVDNLMEMYKRIGSVDFKFPTDPVVSDSAKRFISALLQRNPDDRMTLRQAKNHEWLAKRPSI